MKGYDLGHIPRWSQSYLSIDALFPLVSSFTSLGGCKPTAQYRL
jgi:hypothetical protein